LIDRLIHVKHLYNAAVQRPLTDSTVKNFATTLQTVFFFNHLLPPPSR